MQLTQTTLKSAHCILQSTATEQFCTAIDIKTWNCTVRPVAAHSSHMKEDASYQCTALVYNWSAFHTALQ